MSLANGYDEISSRGKLKYFKEGMNLVTTPEYSSIEEQNRSIIKGMQVVRYSYTKDIQGLKEFNRLQREEKQNKQMNVRKTEEKTFRLDDFGER